MKKTQEILDQFNERFSNPFIFSYVLSWIVLNWKIVVALLWYDSLQIKLSGANSIFDFIEINSDMERGVLYPLIGAFAYTFGMPILKNVVKAFNSWASKWGTSWSLSILKNGQISVNKYLKLRDEYQERTKVLSDVILKESEYLEKCSALETENLGIKDRNNELSRSIQNSDKIINNFSNSRLLDGRWEMIFKNTEGKEIRKTILIEQSRYFEITSYNIKQEIYYVKDFFYQENYNSICFILQSIIKENEKQIAKYEVIKLTFETQDYLVGTIDYSRDIEYRRIKTEK